MTGSPPAEVRRAVADAHRREWAAVLAATVRAARGLDLAEECVQEAYAAALDAWARTGVPANPGAWLTTTARRKALDAARRAAALRTRLPLLAEPEAVEMAYPEQHAVPDDRLRLIFMCCHPALSEPARVALTLRLVCGLPAADIAAVFLVPETTMLARITRAKQKIAVAHIPFAVPERADLPGRVDAVLAVLHLLFTAGHTAPSGPALTRADLAGRAVELAAVLHHLLPTEREVHGLLALLMVNHARRATRTDTDGRLLLLEEQDRSRWDRRAIAAAHRHVLAAMRGGRPGRYALQAAIASLHGTAPTYADTDWAQILELYDELRTVWPSPVVALNRAVAVAMVHGPAAALDEVGELDRGGELAGYHYLPAVRAELLRRLGRDAEAAESYRQALAWADNEAERAFLARRLAETAAG